MIGNLEHNFVYNILGDEGSATFVHQRNIMFEHFAIPLSNRRLWSLSAVGERLIIGPAIRFLSAIHISPSYQPGLFISVIHIIDSYHVRLRGGVINWHCA